MKIPKFNPLLLLLLLLGGSKKSEEASPETGVPSGDSLPSGSTPPGGESASAPEAPRVPAGSPTGNSGPQPKPGSPAPAVAPKKRKNKSKKEKAEERNLTEEQVEALDQIRDNNEEIEKLEKEIKEIDNKLKMNADLKNTSVVTKQDGSVVANIGTDREQKNLTEENIKLQKQIDDAKQTGRPNNEIQELQLQIDKNNTRIQELENRELSKQQLHDLDSKKKSAERTISGLKESNQMIRSTYNLP